jgi:TatD DNase family protein
MNFEYVDIHTHLNLSAFDGDRDEVAGRTQEEGVAYINVGTQCDTSARAVELAGKYGAGVYATVGLHPVHTGKSFHDEKELGSEGRGFTSRGEVFDRDYYRKLAEHPWVVAVGECGLDYYRIDKATKEKQDEAFIAQIELANELKKPLMLHVRPSAGSMDAYEDSLTIVKRYANVPGNVHFFAGDLDVAKKFWDIGYTTSFTGVITFASQYDDVIKNAPTSLLQAETDAPYVAPVPHRGKRNEPMHVREVYRRIAEIRGAEEEEIRKALLNNAKRLFAILPDNIANS